MNVKISALIKSAPSEIAKTNNVKIGAEKGRKCRRNAMTMMRLATIPMPLITTPAIVPPTIYVEAYK